MGGKYFPPILITFLENTKSKPIVRRSGKPPGKLRMRANARGYRDKRSICLLVGDWITADFHQYNISLAWATYSSSPNHRLRETDESITNLLIDYLLPSPIKSATLSGVILTGFLFNTRSMADKELLLPSFKNMTNAGTFFFDFDVLFQFYFSSRVLTFDGLKHEVLQLL